MGSEDSGLLVFDRDGWAMAFVNIADGQNEMESYDVLDGEYEAIYTLDGRVVHAAGVPRGGPVTLTVTEETDWEGLRQRLDRAKAKGQIRGDVEDVIGVANELLREQWEDARPRWLIRLFRRLSGGNPPEIKRR